MSDENEQKHYPRSPNSRGPTEPIFSKHTVFKALLLVRMLSAGCATIPDCDEVFNYWEPTHYLSHNYGLQTWEYSPVYAIRSWAYVGLHAILSRPISYIFSLNKIYEFYGLRCFLAITCALCEAEFYSSVSINISRKIGLLCWAATMTSAGMFHAATAYLPSAFAMYTTMLGTAAFLNRSNGLNTARGLFWFAVGGFLGWPFSLAMALPLVLEDICLGLSSKGLLPTVTGLARAGLLSIAVLCSTTVIDSWAYNKPEIVPWNIVKYNVFSSPGKGPEIYGTEPWWFYLANLTLNFNVLFPLALLSGPLLLLCILFRIPSSPPPVRRMFTTCFPFYLWLTIFTLQSHKEERFMYVLYPHLCLSAATALHLILTILGNTTNRAHIKPKEAHPMVSWAVLGAPLTLSVLLSTSRVLAIISSYSAPMKVYLGIPANATGTLCIGKEWYRYPSSYFIPHTMRTKFIKSDFSGLLPGEFTESGNVWERPGLYTVPKGMNDENREDISKYVDIDQCDFLVDLYFPGRAYDVGSKEVDYVLDTVNWEAVRCERFLDSARTPTLGRTLWMPVEVGRAKRAWGNYCLLMRAKHTGANKKSERIVRDMLTK